MKHLFISAIFVFLSSPTFALEVNNYTTSIRGLFHNITVAFDNLDTKGKVRCLVKKNGKTVGMSSEYINGVGTVIIHIPGGIDGKTTASCETINSDD